MSHDAWPREDALGRPIPWHENIRTMCAYGVDAVRRGDYDALRFEVLGVREKDMVNRVMRDIAPSVPYEIETTLPGGHDETNRW